MGILLYEMNVGIDPFSDEDPMMVYQKILKGKIKFPSFFDRYIRINFYDKKIKKFIRTIKNK